MYKSCPFLESSSHHGANVVIQAKTIPAVEGQKWMRIKSYKKGWFFLKNSMSGLVLTANSTISAPIIKGIFTHSYS